MRTETATPESVSPVARISALASLGNVQSAAPDGKPPGHARSSTTAPDQIVREEASSPFTPGWGTRPNVGFIGAGAVASTLAVALSSSGWRVDAVASRTHASARRLARLIPGCDAEADSQAVVDRCRLIFLTVPDGAISQVASSLHWPADRGVVHCCGAATSSLLSSAATHGALCGSFHPLQTFAALPTDEDPTAHARNRFSGVTFAVEATGWLRQALESMASDLGGRTIEFSPEHRPLYHASAVMSCGALVALLRSAAALWQEMGVDQQTAFRALMPLARTTLENAAVLGPEAATTGPVTRGDVDTVYTHLQALKTLAPDILPLYTELTRVLISHASTLDGKKRNELDRLLAQYGEANSGPLKKLSPSGSNLNYGGQSHA